MKKQLLLGALLSLPVCIVYSQSSDVLSVEGTPVTTINDTEVNGAKRTLKKSAASAAVLWSEDFSSGIPSSWVNQGYDVDPATGVLSPNPLCDWEYRGPNTTPSNAVGSRGKNAGAGPTIQSPTDANGFIIFDSDYLDSDGLTRGAGVSPAPHVGTLSTDTIDLTGYPYVQIAFFSRARNYTSLFKMAVSNDGGVTFPDTVEFHKGLPTNATSSPGDEVTADISNTAGNESMVVLRLIYDGRPSGSSGPGLYYWQIDDMEVRELPAHAFQFTDFNGAPAHDILYPPYTPKYGNLQIDQAVPISFDSNIYNYGSEDQTNVKLVVNVEDASGNVVASLSSPILAVLNSKDTGSFNDFTTTSSWTPSAVGSYNVIFTVESDSVPASPNSLVPADTIPINVNESRYSMGFGTTSNFVGTDNLATGTMIAIGEAFTFPNPNKDTTGFVFVEGISVPFSTATDPTATVFWEVYDTTGFTYGSNGGPVGNPLFSRSYQLDATIPGTTHYFDFTDVVASDTMPLALPSGAAYHVIMNMIPNAAGGVVRIGNDQTVSQRLDEIAAVVAQSDAGNWFGRFNNSKNLSSPIMNLFVAETPTIGLKAYKMQNAVKIYPNPSNGKKVNIAIAEAGDYTLEVVGLSGKVLRSEQVSVNGNEELYRDFSMLPRGIYLINIYNDNFRNTQRLSIE